VNALLGISVVASWGVGAVSSRRNWDSWLGIFHRAAGGCGAEFPLFSFARDGVVGAGRSYRWFGSVAGVVTKMTGQNALKQLQSVGRTRRICEGWKYSLFRNIRMAVTNENNAFCRFGFMNEAVTRASTRNGFCPFSK